MRVKYLTVFQENNTNDLIQSPWTAISLTIFVPRGQHNSFGQHQELRPMGTRMISHRKYDNTNSFPTTVKVDHLIFQNSNKK